MNNKFIYQKKDFMNMGVKEGSFRKLMNDLELNSSDFCQSQILKNGIKANFYTQEAMNIVLNHMQEKNNSKNKAELLILKQNKELEVENQKLQNAITLLKSQYTEELTKIKLESKNKEIKITELKGENQRLKDNWNYSNEKNVELSAEVERLKNRGFFARLFNR